MSLLSSKTKHATPTHIVRTPSHCGSSSLRRAGGLTIRPPVEGLRTLHTNPPHPPHSLSLPILGHITLFSLKVALPCGGCGGFGRYSLGKKKFSPHNPSSGNFLFGGRVWLKPSTPSATLHTLLPYHRRSGCSHPFLTSPYLVEGCF